MRKISKKYTKNYQHQLQKQQPQPLSQKNNLIKMSQERQLQFIKDIYDNLVLNPEQNIKQIDSIFILTKIDNVKVVYTALKTLSQIFINIAPLEAINEKTLETRLGVKITKDQLLILKFQKILLQQYQRYLKILKQLNIQLKKDNFQNNVQIYKEFKKCILQCCITCFNTLWSFNYVQQLINLLIKFINYQSCKKTLKIFLESSNIATLQIKHKIINNITQLIVKKSQKSLSNDIVQILNSTHIDSRYLQKDKQSLDYKKKLLKKKLYRQQAFDKKKEKQKIAESGTLEMKKKKKQEKIKQKLKIKEEVQKQFAQANAIMSSKQLVKHTSKILQELFYIYFKILVERPGSKYLRDILDGILKFAHLINIDLIFSLVQHLDTASIQYRQLWKQNKTKQILQLRLLIVFTAISVLNGPLSMYNMEDVKENKNLYRILKDINTNSLTINRQIFRLIILTLQQSFIKRKQLSQETVASFIRQIAILLNRQKMPKIVLLDIIRILVSKYSKLGRMLQQDNQGFGINSFNQMCQDPQCTNAINTSINVYLHKAIQNTDKYYKDKVQRIVKSLEKINLLSAVKERLNFQEIFQEDLNSFK